MDGGPSQVDTFDPKPMLDKHNGKDPGKLFNVEPTQFNNNGTVLASPWKFKQHGESGMWASELIPHMAKQVDKVALIKSMYTEAINHDPAITFFQTGAQLVPELVHGLHGIAIRRSL